MRILFLMLIGTFVLAELCDLPCHPRRWPRRASALPLRWLPVLGTAGLFLVLTGSTLLALLLTAALLMVLVTASNLKNRLLNEPLVFTDLAVVPAFFRYPSFYLQAVPPFLRILLVPLVIGLIALIVWRSSLAMTPRLIGVILAAASFFALRLCLRRTASRQVTPPDIWTDARSLGLLPTLFLYAWHWKHQDAPPPISPLPQTLAQEAPEIVIVVQCESFADPAELKQEWEALPELEKARAQAVQWGDLNVSGLGAYTMRSEYGVLFGLEEQALGYRQFDPFLTAAQDKSYALPHRLSALYPRRVFLHPHDLRFYDRCTLMPELGFDKLVSDQPFSDRDRLGPYTSDEALGKRLLNETRQGPVFCYAVTMENHGPWPKGRAGCATGAEAWLHHARNGARLLASLSEELAASGKNALLVFFGDHRPALEATDPTAPRPARQTPYVMMRFGPSAASASERPASPVSLTPAGLHQAILREITGENAALSRECAHKNSPTAHDTPLG